MHSALRCDAGAIFARGRRGSHHGLALLPHHGLHVFKVDVDQTFHINNFRNPSNRIIQNVIGRREGFDLGDVIAQHFFKLFVEHDDQRVHSTFQFRKTMFGCVLTTHAFKTKWLGDHRHRQCTKFFGDLGHDRCSTRSGTATHPRRNEHHVRTRKRVFNSVAIDLGRCTTRFRFRASTKAGATNL